MKHSLCLQVEPVVALNTHPRDTSEGEQATRKRFRDEENFTPVLDHAKSSQEVIKTPNTGSTCDEKRALPGERVNDENKSSSSQEIAVL